jgi:dolichol kinase
LADLSEALDALNGTANGTRWRQLYARLAKDYDELTRAIRESRLLRDFTFKRLSPANYARSAFHVIGGVTGALAYHYLLDRTGALIIMTVFVTVFSALELLRRRSAEMNDLLMRFPFFRRIARPHEYYRVNSSTYYAWGMLIAVLVAPRQAVEAACLVLAFGDPVASNLGRKFGRRKLFRDKSWVGTAAFFAAAFTVLLAYQLLLYSAQPLRLQVLVAFTGAMVGALIELFTVRLDDNFTVPLSVALGVGIFLEAAGAAAV